MPGYHYGLKVGRSSVPVTPSYMPVIHSHPSHELYFLISGQRRYFVGHTIYDVAPGNLVLIPKTQLHRTATPGKKGYDRYVLYFYDDDITPLIQLLGEPVFAELMNSGCLHLPPQAARQVQQDMELIEQELATPTPLSRATAIHLLQDILLIALRSGSKKPNCQGENAETIQSVARYISEHYANEITLDEAAQMAHMERTHFSKRFKALTGFGFLEYLTQTRLREADRLLLETNLSVGTIAELCGFSGYNYLGDVFRRWKGASPTQYRILHQNKE